MLISEAKVRFQDDIMYVMTTFKLTGNIAVDALALTMARIHMAATADEREACAMIAENSAKRHPVAEYIAEKIRAREEEINVDG